MNSYQIPNIFYGPVHLQVMNTFQMSQKITPFKYGRILLYVWIYLLIYFFISVYLGRVLKMQFLLVVQEKSNAMYILSLTRVVCKLSSSTLWTKNGKNVQEINIKMQYKKYFSLNFIPHCVNLWCLKKIWRLAYQMQYSSYFSLKKSFYFKVHYY